MPTPVNQTVSSTSCPACTATDARFKFEREGYRYYLCRQCRCLFVDLQLADNLVHEHYNKDYYEGDESAAEGRKGYPSYRAGQATLSDCFTNKLQIIRRYLTKGKILDAGAAYGFFLKTAAPDFDGVGLEVSAYAAEVARTEFQTDVRVGDIEKTDFADASFEAVMMWDIIEHLIRPVHALREVQRILKPGGYLFVSTDDAANWLPRMLGRRWWAMAPPMHLCHFSKQGIGASAALAGLERPVFFPDVRRYTIPEIIRHFGVSYKSSLLTSTGNALDRTWLHSWALKVTRPEQFVAVLRKPPKDNS